MSSENSADKTAPQRIQSATGRPDADAVAATGGGAPAASVSGVPSASAMAQPKDAAKSEPAADGETEMSEATLAQLARICERLGAEPQRSLQMARQLVKRAGQLARERDWSEAQALEYLLSLMLKASGSDHGSQSPD